MQGPFRFSVCNELFGDTAFRDAARVVARLGYTGLEIAPFTLGESPRDISPERRREYRNVLAEEGLEFVGLHWLMVAPAGLHVTTPDVSLRERSWQHIRELIDLCADLSGDGAAHGDGGVMVFGSPKQRNTVDGMSAEDARRIFADELAKVAPQAEARGARILVEALPKNQSDVINTLAEAVAVVDRVHSPAVETMFDTHNAVDETEPHTKVIERYFAHIAHVHVNEIDGREPGTGDYDFVSVMAELARLRYRGWASLEVFDFSRGAERIAGDALAHLEQAAERGVAMARGTNQ